ncbi:DNA-directed DNA polymerase [Tanacetum coccineum]
MGGSYYPIPYSILSIGKDNKTPQRYPDVLTTSWRISIRSMDSFQGLTPKSPSSWHRSLAPMVPTTLGIACKTLNKPSLNMRPRVPMKREAITDRIAGVLPSDTVKNPKLGTHPVLSTRSYPIIDHQCSSHQSTSINAIKAHFNNAITEPQQPEEPEPTPEVEFKDLHLNLPILEVLSHAPIYNTIIEKYVESLEVGKNGSAFVQGETLAKMGDPGLFILPCRLGDSKPFEDTDHIFGLANGTKSYPVRIVKDVEVHIGKLKLLNDFYMLDMKKDPKTPLLVGRGFLATANAVIDCRMAKIAESEDLIEKPIDWSEPPKNGDGAWHAKIRIIDPHGEEFTKTLQSIPTTRKLSERESPREIINLDHFYDT